MYPNNSNGGWRCAVKTNLRNRQSDAKSWAVRRRRDLRNQRERLLVRLGELEQEGYQLD